MNMLACAFAGHNPLRFPFGYDEEDDLCQQIKATLLMQILALYQNGVTAFYSNCEPGAPMWGAELVLRLQRRDSNIQLHCVLPYEEQATKWTPQLRERYFSIVERSNSEYLICTRYENNCYLLCNKYLVDHSNFVLAVYDDDPLVYRMEPVSHLIAYAKNKNRGIITIHPDTGLLTPITITQGLK